MKKQTAIVDVLKAILEYFTSVKFFFKKEFITELYWKHFAYSFALALLPMAVLMLFFRLDETPLLFQMFVSGLCCFIVNGVRETMKEAQARNEGWVYPFDWIDVYFGSYGGVLVALVVWIVISVIK